MTLLDSKSSYEIKIFTNSIRNKTQVLKNSDCTFHLGLISNQNMYLFDS